MKAREEEFRQTAAFVLPEAPIRAELFSIERLEQHAESLAAAQRVSRQPGTGRQLAPRLDDNARVLTTAYRAMVKAAREKSTFRL